MLEVIGARKGGANLYGGVLQPWEKTVRLSGSDETDHASRNCVVCCWSCAVVVIAHQALSNAPSGITPFVTYRQSAISNFLASATTAMRRTRPRSERTRLRN